MDFDKYQDLAVESDQTPSGPNNLTIPLLGLVSEAAGILAEYKKALRDGDPQMRARVALLDELGDVLWYLTNVASKVGLRMSDVAQRNLEKARDRWPLGDGSDGYALFDEGYPETERLPRQFTAEIAASEDASGGATSLFKIDGVPIGDPLRDNAYEDDGYRYHDIAHLGHLALLGWSPVLRGFLRRKRKSNARVDEVEDGGRAIVIEEAVAAIVFDYARRHDYLATAAGIDTDLLVTIKRITAGLEVSTRTMRDWETTILQTYAVWRRLRETGSVHLVVDLAARRMSEGEATPALSSG